jgi:2-dehydro-3-deoxygluconokinase
MDRDVVIIGPLNVDLLLTGNVPIDLKELHNWAGESNVHLCAAGSAGYIAQDTAKYGLRTGMVTYVADDPFGDAILRILNESGLDIKYIKKEKGTLSGIAVYMLLFGSKKRPFTYRLWTHLPWPKHFSDRQKDYLLHSRLIHMAGYLHFPGLWNNEVAKLFQEARRKGIITSLDPQFPLFPIDQPWIVPIREILKYTDLLLVDDNEARNLTKCNDLNNALGILKDAGPKKVIIKKGSDGSIGSTGDQVIKVPAIKVPEHEIQDSIGAGDAYDSGVVFGILKSWPLQECMKLGTLAAASTLRGPGGTLSLSPIDQLLKQLKEF